MDSTPTPELGKHYSFGTTVRTVGSSIGGPVIGSRELEFTSGMPYHIYHDGSALFLGFPNNDPRDIAVPDLRQCHFHISASAIVEMTFTEMFEANLD
jgi:hypothetical protein